MIRSPFLLLLGLFLPASTGGGPLARPAAPFITVPKGPPTFFVTSRGLNGGDLGGLEGADRHCKRLAHEAGLPVAQWRAYLSTQSDKGERAVDARDRIGPGPWFNVQGIRVAIDLAQLHGDTLPLARAGNLIAQATALTEQGSRIPGKNEQGLAHDVLTGSTTAGRAYIHDRYDRTCRNWTYSGDQGSAQMGHSDRDSVGLSISWNSAHQSAGCSPDKLKSTGSLGLFYCFAIVAPRAS